MRPGGLCYWVGSGKQGTKLRAADGRGGGVQLVDVVEKVTDTDGRIVFVVHRSIGKRDAGEAWTVSHVRSGRLVRYARTKTRAIKIAQTLAPVGDWNKAASRLPRTLFAQARAALKGIET